MGEDIAEIAKRMRKAAESATPGPWTREKPKRDADGFACGVGIAATYGRQMIYANPPGGSFPSFDADHIVASNPANVIALLDAYDAQAKAIEKALTGLHAIVILDRPLTRAQVREFAAERLAEIKAATRPVSPKEG